MIIPKNIPECFTFLKVLVDKPSLKAIKNKTREELVDCQHDLGMLIRNNWLYSLESPLVQSLVFLGLEELDEDSLAAMIIELFWEHLNGIEYKEVDFIKKLVNMQRTTNGSLRR